MFRDLDPTRSNDFSKRAQNNSFLVNFSENTPALRRANRNEICPRLRIVRSSQSDRTAMKFPFFRHANSRVLHPVFAILLLARRGTIHRALPTSRPSHMIPFLFCRRGTIQLVPPGSGSFPSYSSVGARYIVPFLCASCIPVVSTGASRTILRDKDGGFSSPFSNPRLYAASSEESSMPQPIKEPAWQFQHSVQCNAPRKFAWSYWTNTANSNDPPAQFALDGPFDVGSWLTTTLTGQTCHSIIRDCKADREACPSIGSSKNCPKPALELPSGWHCQAPTRSPLLLKQASSNRPHPTE